jgi:hypothetical protein
VFAIPEGHKFACVVLDNAGVDRALRDDVCLGDGIWAVFGPPFELDNHWSDWLGSLQIERLRRGSLTIVATARSNALQVLDAENEALRERVIGLFYSILLVEVFHQDGGLIIGGANVDGNVSVRQVSFLEPHYRPAGVVPLRIDLRWLQDAYTIAVGMDAVHSPRGSHQRLRRGFHAWVRGIQEYNGEERVHQFVRSVEATIHPEVGRSRAQFMHRGQLFAGNTETARARLGELYDLRGAAEHMNLLDSVLGDYREAERETIGLRRAFQAQVLASDVYRRVFANAHFHAVFQSDDSIARFWDEPWARQVAAWGNPIDLDAVAARRFRV